MFQHDEGPDEQGDGGQLEQHCEKNASPSCMAAAPWPATSAPLSASAPAGRTASTSERRSTASRRCGKDDILSTLRGAAESGLAGGRSKPSSVAPRGCRPLRSR